VAREELKAITRRMQRGRVASASEGKSISKVPPYGYKRNDDLILDPDPETAWVVKKMFEMMRDGHGRQAIAQELDKLEIKPPNNKRKTWSPSSITAIIKNEAYLGTIIWGAVKYVKRNGKYKKTKAPRSKWTIKENAHTALVSRELFEAANRAHSGRWRPSHNVSKGLSNPLAGILRCELCGYVMLYQPRPNRPNDTIRCAQPTCKESQKASAFPIVEQRILEGLSSMARKIDESVGNEDEPANNDVPYKKVLIDKKKGEVDELLTQKSNLHDFLERGVYDIETFMDRQQNITGRINILQDEIRSLESEIQKEELRKASVDDFLPQLQSVLDAYQNADIKRKNALLKTILEKATYLRKKEWNKPDQFVIQLYPKI
jgi:hypothetical protein